MQGKVNLDLSFCLAESGFSLDELVFKLGELFENKAFSELLRLVLQLTQEALLWRMFNGKTQAVSCCGQSNFKLNGGYNRRLRTSLGEVNMYWHRVCCRNCGKTFALLKEFLNLGRYQGKTHELERLVVNAVAETSYRRAVKGISEHGLINLSHHTAHNWVIRTDCDEIGLSNKVIASMGPTQVVADGTKFKAQAVDGKARRGDLKVAIGVNCEGEVFPLGSWAGETWEKINAEWKKNELKFSEGSIIVCDGEPGLAEAFAEQVEEQQRCHWHIVRDMYHAMHSDGAKLETIKEVQKGLAGVLAIELPEEDFEKVSETEKSEIEERMEAAENVMDKLINYLSEKNFYKAATYIEGAKRGMFGYVRRWLKLGVICPRASSLIERVIRELGRRLKKLAYNWSDMGAAKIARIILKKFTNEKEWEEYWMSKMKILGNVVFNSGNYKVTAQNLRH
jgi:hypothetical protein